jgi:hypothetical protein
VGLLFVGLALLFTWPLPLHPSRALPAAQPADALLHVHRLWFVPRMVAAGHDPYGWTDLLRSPQGTTQYLETLIPLVGIAAWPARLVGDPLLHYNLVVVALLALNAWSGFLLVRDRTASAAAGVVGGITYGLSPYLLAHLGAGHLNLVAAFWPPLFVLCLLRALERGSFAWAALAGLCLAGTVYTDLQWTLALGLLAPLLVAWRLVAGGRARAARALACAGLAAALAALLACPLLVGIADEAAGAAAPGKAEAIENSAVLLAFVAPQPAHPVWGTAVRGWYAARGLDEGDEQVVALGHAPLALAAVGLASRRTRRPIWLLALLAFVVLALGPRLHLASRAELKLTSEVTMPYDLLRSASLVRLGRAPARFAAPATLCLAVLAGYGVVALARRAPTRHPWAVAAVVLVGAELLAAPFPLHVPRTPAMYQALSREPCPGPLFELPVLSRSGDIDDVPPANRPDVREKERLYFQVAHGCPISGGYVSRNRSLTDLQQAWQDFARGAGDPDPATMRARLAEAGFARLVIWRDAYASDAALRRDEDAARRMGLGAPWYDGADGAAYRLR